jgi:hypothetical protein
VHIVRCLAEGFQSVKELAQLRVARRSLLRALPQRPQEPLRTASCRIAGCAETMAVRCWSRAWERLPALHRLCCQRDMIGIRVDDQMCMRKVASHGGWSCVSGMVHA